MFGDRLGRSIPEPDYRLRMARRELDRLEGSPLGEVSWWWDQLEAIMSRMASAILAGAR